MNQKDRGRER